MGDADKGKKRGVSENPGKDKDLFFIASSKEDLSAFPSEVKSVMGFALRMAQRGKKHDDAKPLKGFKGAGVLEVVASHDGSAYRGVYTVRFKGVVYVLHAFQKKSKSGIKTPPQEIELVERRLKKAEEHYADWSADQEDDE